MKQPGTQGTPVEVTLILPPRYTPEGSTGWKSLTYGNLRWSGKLTTDVELELLLVPDEL